MYVSSMEFQIQAWRYIALHYFPLAAVTSHHKPGDLKHTHLLSDNPAGYRSETGVSLS